MSQALFCNEFIFVLVTAMTMSGQSLVIAQDESHYFLAAGMLFPVFATRPKSELFMENFLRWRTVALTRRPPTNLNLITGSFAVSNFQNIKF